MSPALVPRASFPRADGSVAPGTVALVCETFVITGWVPAAGQEPDAFVLARRGPSGGLSPAGRESYGLGRESGRRYGRRSASTSCRADVRAPACAGSRRWSPWRSTATGRPPVRFVTRC